jgi:hypothetical protein
MPPDLVLRRDPYDFDVAADAFASACLERFEGGRALASADTDRLWTLAHRLAADLSAWTTAHHELDAARAGAFPPESCGRRLVEVLFDEALTHSAARVLAAALDMALAAVTAPLDPNEAASGR